jgi:hypothetical protein
LERQHVGKATRWKGYTLERLHVWLERLHVGKATRWKGYTLERLNVGKATRWKDNTLERQYVGKVTRRKGNTLGKQSGSRVGNLNVDWQDSYCLSLSPQSKNKTSGATVTKLTLQND